MSSTVAAMVTVTGQWDISRLTTLFLDAIVQRIVAIRSSQPLLGSDIPSCLWSVNQVFSSKLAYDNLARSTNWVHNSGWSVCLFPIVCWLLWKQRYKLVIDIEFIGLGYLIIVECRMASKFARFEAAHLGSRIGYHIGHGSVVSSEMNMGSGSLAFLGTLGSIALPGNALVDDTHDLLSREWDVFKRRISRDMNKVADVLVVSLRDGLVGVLLFDFSPDFIEQVVIEDNQGADNVLVVG
ncbi:hypothetical protein V6N11_054859 [Hibiscus sabdariffa]|uniref:Uncharacterized protein n=1 Tax=Hibiscus sabdariffa TaxID=183260 RepID=A0ABR2P370_9ROSI